MEKSKPNVLSYKEKYEILLQLIDGKRQCDVEKERGLHHSVVYRIWKFREKIYARFNRGKKLKVDSIYTNYKKTAISRGKMQATKIKTTVIKYQCRICQLILNKKYLVAKHITDKHAHNKAEVAAIKPYLILGNDSRCINSLLDWRMNPDNPPWTEVKVSLEEIQKEKIFKTDRKFMDQIQEKIEPHHHSPYVRLLLLKNYPTEETVESTTLEKHGSGKRVKRTRKLPIKLIEEEEVDLTCATCNKKFSCPIKLSCHELIHKPRKPCTLCEKTFRGRSYLRYHMVNAHADHPTVRSDPEFDTIVKQRERILERRRLNMKVYVKPKKLKCPHCSLMFPWESHFRRHVAGHLKHRPFACTTCGASYKHADGLRRHKELNKCEEVITNNASRAFKCSQCDSTLKSQKGLWSHERIFHGIIRRPKIINLVCMFCGYKAVSSQTLTIHNRIHTGEKPFECKACNTAFAVQGNLYKHMRVHCPKAKEMGLVPEIRKQEVNKSWKNVPTGNEEIKCSMCIQTFATTYKRTCHEVSHGDNFPCSFCHGVFNHNMGLVLHKLRAHPEKIQTLSCHLCDKTFQTQTSFKQHLQEVHNQRKLFKSRIKKQEVRNVSKLVFKTEFALLARPELPEAALLTCWTPEDETPADGGPQPPSIFRQEEEDPFAEFEMDEEEVSYILQSEILNKPAKSNAVPTTVFKMENL